jgi:excisionase family DNA binding protein
VEEGRRSGGDQAETDQATGRRLTVPEAAEALGITADAVRSRIKRGTLPTVREGGRVYVVMDANDRPTAQAQPTDRPGEERLYQEMQDRIRYLELQVEEEREARRRADTLLARLMDRMPELEAPSASPSDAPAEQPETVEEGPERAEARSDASGTQEGTQRRPWWRRVFGG